MHVSHSKIVTVWIYDLVIRMDLYVFTLSCSVYNYKGVAYMNPDRVSIPNHTSNSTRAYMRD